MASRRQSLFLPSLTPLSPSAPCRDADLKKMEKVILCVEALLLLLVYKRCPITSVGETQDFLGITSLYSVGSVGTFFLSRYFGGYF